MEQLCLRTDSDIHCSSQLSTTLQPWNELSQIWNKNENDILSAVVIFWQNFCRCCTDEYRWYCSNWTYKQQASGTFTASNKWSSYTAKQHATKMLKTITIKQLKLLNFHVSYCKEHLNEFCLLVNRSVAYGLCVTCIDWHVKSELWTMFSLTNTTLICWSPVAACIRSKASEWTLWITAATKPARWAFWTWKY